MTEVQIDLVCKECNNTYQKPEQYTMLADGYGHQYRSLKSFYTRQITFCDPCRRKKERAMLNHGLKAIVEVLSKTEES